MAEAKESPNAGNVEGGMGVGVGVFALVVGLIGVGLKFELW